MDPGHISDHIHIRNFLTYRSYAKTVQGSQFARERVCEIEGDRMNIDTHKATCRSYSEGCVSTFRKIPHIGKPVSATEWGLQHCMSHTKAKRELAKLEYIKLSKYYWLLAADYEMIKGTALADLLHKAPLRGWKSLNVLRVFEGVPIRENLVAALGYQGYKDLISSKVLRSYRRFTDNCLLYFCSYS